MVVCRSEKTKSWLPVLAVPQIVTNCVIEIYVRPFSNVIGCADVTRPNDIYYGQFIGASRLPNMPYMVY